MHEFISRRYCCAVPGGLSLREGMTILEECYKTGCMSSLDLVEVNVDLVTEEFRRHKTLDAAKRLIMAAFGNDRGGNMPLQTRSPAAAAAANKPVDPEVTIT